MNNEQEFEFLNDTPKEEIENPNNCFINIFIMLLSIICNLIIIIVESFYKLLNVILWGDTTYTLYKTAKNKYKRRKSKRWF